MANGRETHFSGERRRRRGGQHPLGCSSAGRAAAAQPSEGLTAHRHHPLGGARSPTATRVRRLDRTVIAQPLALRQRPRCHREPAGSLHVLAGISVMFLRRLRSLYCAAIPSHRAGKGMGRGPPWGSTHQNQQVAGRGWSRRTRKLARRCWERSTELGRHASKARHRRRQERPRRPSWPRDGPLLRRWKVTAPPCVLAAGRPRRR